MSDALQALLQPLGLATSAYPPSSRYNGIPTAKHLLPDGRVVTYLTRRIVPETTQFVALQNVTVLEGDRLDRLAAKYLGDPLAFWRLCDANGALRPEELTERPGATLRITLPAGIAGAPRA